MPFYSQRRYYRSDRIAYELAREQGRRTQHGEGMPLREFEPVFNLSLDRITDE